MKLRLLLSVAIMSLLASGCSTKQINNFEFYQDNAAITDEDIKLSMTTSSGSVLYTGNVSVSVELVNTNPKPKEIKLTEHKIYRESDNAEYSASAPTTATLNLECDVKQKITFYATLPTLVTEDKYYFALKYANTEIKYHLYERDDSQREQIDVEFYIDGELKETKKVPFGRELVKYPWVSSDYVYSSDKWYFDSAMREVISNDFKVIEPLKVYGVKKSILKYNNPISSSIFVSGVNFIPSNNEIVVPKTFEGTQIYSILAGSFRNNLGTLETVYIPSTMNGIGIYNFSYSSNIKYIYFEGTEEQWNSINESTISSSITVVFNTYK